MNPILFGFPRERVISVINDEFAIVRSGLLKDKLLVYNGGKHLTGDGELAYCPNSPNIPLPAEYYFDNEDQALTAIQKHLLLEAARS